jgi:DNA-binding MarR family transcriptional regulator
MARRVSDRDYARLLRIRTQLRRFEHWSAERAAEQGLTASQHQLLLAVRGHPDESGPTIGQVADYLLIRHNSAVELVDRTEQSGLLRRERDSQDHRVVRLKVTSEGSRRLEALSGAHLDELAALAPLLEETVNTTVLPEQPGAPTEPRRP